ncbi:MAG: ribosome biogenesis GTPase Der [Chloroflexota bacterium]
MARRARRTSQTIDQDEPTEGLPIVAVVGRPNVGKSTLFNRVVGERIAIVEDRARTTRDRIYDVGEWNGRRFIVVDTGGLETRPGDAIEERVQEQARLAIAEADVIVFVVDAEVGLTPADEEASALLRTAKAPVIVAVNKADNPRRELEGAEFHSLGWEETHPVSAVHGRGVADLLDVVVFELPPESASEIERKRVEDEAARDDSVVEEESEQAAWSSDDRPVRIAIIGRPNVGKSSLLNMLLGQPRAIVSDIPGTTRDAIDTAFEWAGRTVRLIDTAGVRRRGKVASGPAAERFATLRALKAVTRADVAVLVIDAVDGMTSQDDHVAGYALDEGAGLVIAINKWDLVEKDDHTFDEYVAKLRRQAPFLAATPILSISAMTGQRVERVLEAAIEIAAERRRRIPTPTLNAWLRDVTARRPPATVRGRQPRFFYATQAGSTPPTFVIFASDAAAVHFSYRRYLENQLRDAFGFGGTPIRLVIRERERETSTRPQRRRSSPRGAPPSTRRSTARSRG